MGCSGGQGCVVNEETAQQQDGEGGPQENNQRTGEVAKQTKTIKPNRNEANDPS